MLVVGAFVGIFVWVFVTAFTSGVVLHKADVGGFEGFVAGVWAAWPIINNALLERKYFLHPVPKRYKMPLKLAFSKVRQTINDKTYNFGDRWHVTTADTLIRRITANLRYNEEESRGFSGTQVSSIRHDKVRVQRLIELDVLLKDSGDDSTIVQLDFRPTVEGLNFSACDTIIGELQLNIANALGEGELAGDPVSSGIPAPPWWLLGLTAFGLLVLLGDTWKAVFGS